jgi:hypothetical protein
MMPALPHALDEMPPQNASINRPAQCIVTL